MHYRSQTIVDDDLVDGEIVYDALVVRVPCRREHDGTVRLKRRAQVLTAAERRDLRGLRAAFRAGYYQS